MDVPQAAIAIAAVAARMNRNRHNLINTEHTAGIFSKTEKDAKFCVLLIVIRSVFYNIICGSSRLPEF